MNLAQFRSYLANIIIVAIVGLFEFLSLAIEGYLPKINLPFGIILGIVFLFDLWVATQISTKRLVALILVASIAGYLTQVVGSTSSHIWIYDGKYNSYVFVAFIFALSAIAMFGMSVRIFGRLLAKLKIPSSRILGPILVIAIFALLIATLGVHRSNVGAPFWIFYVFLFSFAIYASLNMRLGTLLGLCIAAWIVGNLGEFLGSQSQLWTFPLNLNYPPIFLVFGSWPLEFVLHYSLSAFLVGESLD
ncbi:MAG: hypothetical protein ACE5IE_01245 [Dehalococcoidia bacterium]